MAVNAGTIVQNFILIYALVLFVSCYAKKSDGIKNFVIWEVDICSSAPISLILTP